VLTNGQMLTLNDLYCMKIPADLVVMSACETGKGKIYKTEGIVGLTRAFMFAGAPRVMCSLWNVDDEATQALMVKFYELWNPKDGKKVFDREGQAVIELGKVKGAEAAAANDGSCRGQRNDFGSSSQTEPWQ